MPKFAFVVFGDTMKIQERFDLEIVRNPKKLGYKLEVSTIKTDVEEILISAVQKLEEIPLEVIFHRAEYVKSEVLRRWLERNTNKRMALELSNPTGVRYANCIVTAFDMSEKETPSMLVIPLTIRPLSPFYRIVENTVTVRPSGAGKFYPYRYPYRYGGGVIENNNIPNTYIKDIPLVVRVYGVMTNPVINLADESGKIYATVAFENTEIKAGQYLTIDAVEQKIRLWDGEKFVDYYSFLNPVYQSFLFARGETRSKLSVNLDVSQSGYLEASYLQYEL